VRPSHHVLQRGACRSASGHKLWRSPVALIRSGDDAPQGICADADDGSSHVDALPRPNLGNPHPFAIQTCPIIRILAPFPPVPLLHSTTCHCATFHTHRSCCVMAIAICPDYYSSRGTTAIIPVQPSLPLGAAREECPAMRSP